MSFSAVLDANTLDPVAIRAAHEQQAADLNPPWPLDQLVAALEVAGVPRFAAAVRTARP